MSKLIQAIGISRGGKNSKVYALVTENFQLIGLLLSRGQVHDSECDVELLSKVEIEGKIVLGDKAFCWLRFAILFKAEKLRFVFPTR